MRGYVEALEPRMLLAAFTPGNLVVLRVGDGTTSLSSDAAPVSLVELSPANGSVVQTINLPSAGSNALTVVGNSNLHGLLSLSGNGQLLTFAGYRADAGADNPGGADLAGQVPRVIGMVGADGVVDTSQAIGTGGDQSFWNGQFRSVVTNDGTSFWVSGSAGSAANGGVRYVANHTATSSAAIVDTAIAENTRQLQILGGNLYMTTGASAPGRSVFQVGTGLPTTAPAALTPSISTASSPQANSYYFTDLDVNRNWNSTGFDTLYVVSTSPTQLDKYSFDGTNWIAKGSLTFSGISNLVGVTSGTSVQLLATNSTGLHRLTDTSGQAGTLNGAFTQLAPAGSNFAFRGVSFVPGSNPTNVGVAPANIDENSPIGTAVGVLTSFTFSGESSHFSLVSGAGDDDNSKFTISGIDLFTAASIDFETQSSYSIRLRVRDPGKRFSFEKAVTITANNLNDNSPVIGGITFNAAENGTSVGTVTATDADGGPVSFSKTGGADGALFSITSGGVLTFVTAPDFENRTDANADGVYEVQVTATDGARTDVETVLVTITDENEPPSVNLTGATTSLPEDADTTTRTKIADINIVDDALGSESLALSGSDASLFEIFEGDLYLLAQAVLDFETNPQLEVTVEVDDASLGASPDASAALLISVTDVNEAPRIGFSQVPLSYVENEVPQALVPGAHLLDQDSPDFDGGSLSVVVVAGYASDDRLSVLSTGAGAGQISVAGNEVSYEGVVLGSIDDAENGVNGPALIIRFGNDAPLTGVQALIRSIAFATLGDAPSTDQRSIEFRVLDGDGAISPARLKTVNVVAVNDRPSMAFGGGRTYREGNPGAQVVANAPVSDVDDPHFDGGTLTVGFGTGTEAADVLFLAERGGITLAGGEVSYNAQVIGQAAGGDFPNPLVVTLQSENATAAAVRALVEAVSFKNTSENPTPGGHAIRFTLNDGESNSVVRTRTMNVVPINDRPILSGGGGVIGYQRNASPIALLPLASVLEDQPHFNTGNLRVVNAGASSIDMVLIKGAFTVEAGTNKVFHGDIATGIHIGDLNEGGGLGTTDLVVTFNANATVAMVEELARSIKFRTRGANALAIGPRDFTLQLTDSLGLAGNTARKRLSVK